MKKRNLCSAAIFFLMVGFTHTIYAADIAATIRSGQTTNESNGGNFEIGIGQDFAHRPDVRYKTETQKQDATARYSLFLNGEFRYNGLFIEAAQGTVDGVNIGFNLVEKERISIDFLAASGDLLGVADEEEKQEFDQYKQEGSHYYTGAGIRTTAYFNNYIIQYRLVTDVHAGAGITSTLRLGGHWLYKNWNIHTIVSGEFRSKESNNALYGIGSNNSLYSVYEAGAGINYGAEVGLTYPVSLHWVFRTTARYVKYSSEVYKSPLFDRKDAVNLRTTLSYVF